jgi:hypothetical protein
LDIRPAKLKRRIHGNAYTHGEHVHCLTFYVPGQRQWMNDASLGSILVLIGTRSFQ